MTQQRNTGQKRRCLEYWGQIRLLICFLVVFSDFENGAEAFCLSFRPGIIRTTKSKASWIPGHVTNLPRNACTLRSLQNTQSAAVRLCMQGGSWLDRAIDKLVGDGGYDPSLSGELSDETEARGYYVILEDDNDHSVDEVVKMVRKVCVNNSRKVKC